MTATASQSPLALHDFDVTEGCRAEEERRQQLEQKVYHSQKLESLGVLAGGIAHDFNNLLVGILGGADLLLRDLPADSSHRSLVEMIRSAGERASQLTRQMLDYAGKNRVTRQAVDLNQVIGENLALLKAGLPKNISIVPILAADLPTVSADPGQVQQIVMNLLLNAAEAMVETPGTIRVSTGMEVNPVATSPLDHDLPSGQYVYVEVADQGCGMSPEVSARIYEPFYSTKATGRGLGLAAVQGIVQAHNGDIRIRSVQGQGTTFRILLPAGVAASLTSVAANSSQEQRSGLILVIDDESHSRSVAVQALQQSGYSVLVAADGQEAVKLFQAHQSQLVLVLLDMVMPGLSGVEILAALRQIRPDANVLLISGYAKDVALPRFGEGELAGFLQKPYTVQALLDAVGPALSTGRTTQKQSTTSNP